MDLPTFKQTWQMRPFLYACGTFLLLARAQADPIATVNLNGIWSFTPKNGSPTTIQVPGGGWYKQGFTGISEADYERQITIPNVADSQVTKLEFGAVNYQADVYIDSVFVGSQITSFTPSAFDLSAVALRQ